LIAGGIQTLIREHSRLAGYVPAYWYSGLYEQLRPAVRSQALLRLGKWALPALGYALAAFVVTHLPGYRGHARQLIEGVPCSPSGPGRVRAALNVIADRFLLKHPVQQAVFHFIGQTISRSMKHRLFLSTHAGFGAALAVISLGHGRAGLLCIPLTLSFVLISGLRAAFNFPAELSANWAFQISDTNHTRETLIAMRKWVVFCGIGPLFLLLAPLELAFFPWTSVLFQLFYGVTLSILLMEVMFFDFRKIPFTCSYFPGKINLVLLLVIYVSGFSFYSSTMADLEVRLMNAPLAAAAFFCVAACAWLVVWNWHGRGKTESGLEYDDEGDPAVRTLGLTLQ
jgi:hypothetical protein